MKDLDKLLEEKEELLLKKLAINEALKLVNEDIRDIHKAKRSKSRKAYWEQAYLLGAEIEDLKASGKTYKQIHSDMGISGYKFRAARYAYRRKFGYVNPITDDERLDGAY